ncbi:hypothetical protein AKUA2003_01150 [Apilactobacillus kunkeei]|nr:hypothetical protein AKUA2003_01150 [Apilactobacillus kunkeei]CAI2555600.1 hypothetical protein AKUA1001_01140 [Apilactobacillus kunkeei]CAI2801076.1 hypothetical protein AKUA2002_01150 [Apilactobacillus kunkeei]
MQMKMSKWFSLGVGVYVILTIIDGFFEGFYYQSPSTWCTLMGVRVVKNFNPGEFNFSLLITWKTLIYFIVIMLIWMALYGFMDYMLKVNKKNG